MKKLILVFALALVGCTENQRARSFGGTGNVKLPPGQKLLTATWRDHDLFYLYRPMRPNETPETYILKESASWGFVEGQVIFTESK